jgi:hypothetical protein
VAATGSRGGDVECRILYLYGASRDTRRGHGYPRAINPRASCASAPGAPATVPLAPRVIAGRRAERFAAELGTAAGDARRIQLLLARATGNSEHGNER